MYTLRISLDWSAQAKAIRNVETEHAKLIDFGNNFYRVSARARSLPCQPDAFLMPREGVH